MPAGTATIASMAITNHALNRGLGETPCITIHRRVLPQSQRFYSCGSTATPKNNCPTNSDVLREHRGDLENLGDCPDDRRYRGQILCDGINLIFDGFQGDVG